jgi:uncharacterized protein (DUF362 family)/Pyruvate/2-oxoacid:ferredoxin oxidoreductase delta subunit
MTRLAIIVLDEYNADALAVAFRTAFAELGLAESFRRDEKILIKPNLLSAVPPEKAATPHPTVFEALARELLHIGVTLTYGDSPATEAPDVAAKACGIAAVADSLDIPLADFISRQDQPLPGGKILRQLPLACGVAAADGVVSLGKLKTHALAGMTGVIKNLFGVMPGLLKANCHANYPEPELFCQTIVDIATAIRPRLSVLDGVVAMEGNGPRNGKPRRVGVILAGEDPVAVDAAGAFLIGLAEGSVLTTSLAEAAGLGESDLASIDACLIEPLAAGEPGAGASVRSGWAADLLRPYRVADFIPANRLQPAMALARFVGTPLLRQFILNRPVVDADDCIRCGACATSCPLQPKAIVFADAEKPPMHNYRRCIRCYCCQEICPTGAIDVRRSLIGKILHT